TGIRQYESMPLYVRLGIHLLYVGPWKAKLLETGILDAILEKETIRQGRYFDQPDSVKQIPSFIQTYQISLSEALLPKVEDYHTFNEFFYRRLQPEARPIASADDPVGLPTVCDSRLIVFPNVTAATKLWIKGANFSVEHLLQDKTMAAKFADGPIAIFRLAPQDYHRFHAPLAAICTFGKRIPGKYYTVNPLAINERIDVLTENARTVHAFTAKLTPDDAPFEFALVPVGAMMVGSILLTGATPGTKLDKGDELGYFAFGGSTVVAVFPPGSRVQFDADLLANSKLGVETLVRMGERIAVVQ
ncbi:phosphatidylserine decarboxylase-domain-containing protein, partial [Thamnocephalis sphaerospora]